MSLNNDVSIPVPINTSAPTDSVLSINENPVKTTTKKAAKSRAAAKLRSESVKKSKTRPRRAKARKTTKPKAKATVRTKAKATVRTKAKAVKPKVARKSRDSLTQFILKMMRRSNGVTREQVLKRTGWKAISMQQQVSNAGYNPDRDLKISKERPYSYRLIR